MRSKIISSICVLIYLATSLFSPLLVNAQTAIELNPVLVELFTSEGCSSCPPADEIMADLQKEYQALHKPVYFIAFHVDYWNYLGWKDAFSHPDFTLRQQEYGSAFGLSSIYTPQSVVNGKKQMIGSKKQLLKEAIEKELITGNPDHLTIKADYQSGPNQISVIYHYSGNQTEKDIHFVLLEKEQSVQVLRGENAGSTLKHIQIVKQWEHIPVRKDGVYIFKPKVKINLRNYAFIAFVQSYSNQRIESVEDGF